MWLAEDDCDVVASNKAKVMPVCNVTIHYSPKHCKVDNLSFLIFPAATYSLYVYVMTVFLCEVIIFFYQFINLFYELFELGLVDFRVSTTCSIPLSLTSKFPPPLAVN